MSPFERKVWGTVWGWHTCAARSCRAFNCLFVTDLSECTAMLFAQEGGGGMGMGNILDSIKKAQQFVQVEAGKVQEELAK